MTTDHPPTFSWLLTLFSFRATPVFARVRMVVTGLGLYTLLCLLADHWSGGHLTDLKANVPALLGLVLGLLLVFRTNTAYDRWWEARKLWGSLVNDSRNLAIKVTTCVQADDAERDQLGRWLIRFAYALKDHLRNCARLADYPEFAAEPAPVQHVPSYISQRIYERIEGWRQGEKLGGFELLFLDRHAAALMDICGACERIRNTRISASYRHFIRQSITLYLLSLPWGLIHDYGFWAIPAVMMAGYFMTGLELIAEDIEEPFGTSADDIGLDNLCERISESICQIMELKPAA